MSKKDLSYLKQAIIHWEIGRIIYNLILLPIGLSFSYNQINELGISIYMTEVLFYGIAANLFYSLGPLSDSYLFSFGIQLGKYRNILFTLGLLFGSFVTFIGALFSNFHID